MVVEPVTGTPLIEARELRTAFIQRHSLLGTRHSVTALDGVTLSIRAGTTLGVVGESGSGKSTLARAITMLQPADAGEVWFEGAELSRLSASALRRIRPRLQILFQDSATAFNPGFTVAQALEEPLVIGGGRDKKARIMRVTDLLRQVGIPEDAVSRSVLSFSGGQKQRLAIARALAASPKLMVLDETFSGLDLSIRAQIVNLLMDLQGKNDLTYVVISHDLGFVSQFCEEIAVMHGGQIVERGVTSEVLTVPQHQHTKALLRSALSLAGGGEGMTQ